MLRLVASAFAIASLSGAAVAADIPAPTIPPPAPILLSPGPIAFNWSGFYFGGHGGWGFGQAPFVDGAVAGGQIGVNWQADAFVIGAEGDGSWVNWDGADAVGTARLRGGFAFDRFFVYATGGAAFQDFEDTGWVVGGGLEYAITNNWTVGGEYLYYSFDPGASDVFRGRVNYLFGGLFGGAAPVSIMSLTPIAFDWTGFYIGAHGGWSFVSGPNISDGFEVGGQVGVNRQYGSFVAGIEIDPGYVDWGPVTTAGSIRLRGGLAFNRFLAYATGGLGIEDSIGWSVGGGVEYALTDRWSVGAEYIHHDFEGGHKADLVRGRVNYLFNTVRGG
jgi:outer membrane immunogenic protein